MARQAPVLNEAIRKHLRELHRRRRQLATMIRVLADERAAIPNAREMAREMGVSYTNLMRCIHGRG